MRSRQSCGETPFSHVNCFHSILNLLKSDVVCFIEFSCVKRKEDNAEGKQNDLDETVY